MKTDARKLAIVAALAAALPLAARADWRDQDGRFDDRAPPQSYGTPAPGHDHHSQCGHPVPGYGPGYGRDLGWGPGTVSLRRHDWRARELAQIRAEMAALDAQRARFHERFAGRPGKLRKFDRWYFAERTALERRYAELAWVVMR
ncbi:MAG TPA: hypothetical protein VLS93_03415 [Anaeromyxobacteraceae bacterium]|nr:hypothetical protein [Anaeromyxobacteraceae bacterium]